MKRSKTRHSRTFRALVSTTVGAVFAIAVGSAITLAPAIGIPGVSWALVSLERAGIDVGMRLHSVWVTHRQTSPNGTAATREPAFVFLDIDELACAALLGSSAQHSRCSASHPAQPEIVAEVLDKVLRPRSADASSTPPRAIILDSSIISSNDKLNNLLRLNVQTQRIPIVAAVPSRWSGAHQLVVMQSSTDPVRQGLLPQEKTVVATARGFLDPSDDDATFRRYAPMLPVRIDAEATTSMLPTVGFAAAVVAERGLDGIAELDKLTRRPSSAITDTPSGKVCPSDEVHTIAKRYRLDARLFCLNSYSQTTDGVAPAIAPSMVFSIRSVALSRQAQDRAQLAGSSSHTYLSSVRGNVDQSVYRYVRVAQIKSDGSALEIAPIEPSWLSDSVIVIGTSSQTSDDTHDTPIGAMSGAEVIINAARAFLTFPGAAKPSLGQRALHKVQLATVAAVIFAPFWFLIYMFVDWCESAKFWRKRYFFTSLICLTFLVGIVTATAGLVLLESNGSVLSASRGHLPNDVLTPVFAIAIEGFAEAAALLLSALHRSTEHAFTTILQMVRRAKG